MSDTRQIDRYRKTIHTELIAVDGLPERNGMVIADGDAVWLAGPPGTLLRFSPTGDRTVFRHPCKDKYGDPLAFSTGVRLDDGRLLLATFATAVVLERDGAAFVQRKAWPLLSGRSSALSTMIAGDPAGTVMVASAYDYLHRFALEGEGVHVQDDDDPFWGVAVSRDGTRVANGRESGKIELREPGSLEVTRVLEGSTSTTLALAFSPDGKTLAVADDVTRFLLFDLDTGASREVQGLSKVVDICPTPDGSGLVAVCLSRLLGVIDLADPEYARHVWPEAEFDQRYLDGGALLGDDLVIARVEKLGVLVTRFDAHAAGA